MENCDQQKRDTDKGVATPFHIYQSPKTTSKKSLTKSTEVMVQTDIANDESFHISTINYQTNYDELKKKKDSITEKIEETQTELNDKITADSWKIYQNKKDKLNAINAVINETKDEIEILKEQINNINNKEL